MTADLSDHIPVTIRFPRIPRTEAERALVVLPKIGVISVTQDCEPLH